MISSYENVNDFFNNMAWGMDNWPTYGRKESGTGDDYKLQLKEKIQFFYTINDMTQVITDYASQKQYPWWAVSEILSETFAMNPPIMSRYRPDLIESSYKLRDDKTTEYMYGRRWSEWNQILNVIQTLSDRQDSKRAVINIFTGYDTDPNRADVPCTLGYTFKIRDNKINMTTFFRSHDIFAGHRYDMILSSFIAQLIAMGVNAKAKTKIEPGTLGIYEDSLHVYPLRDAEKYKLFLQEAHSNGIEERFDLMYPYETVAEIYDDLWKVEKTETSSYYNNFSFALEKIEKIKNPAFRDFARVFYNRNLKFLEKEDGYKKLNYETKIFKWID